jgi:hypothetical protein
MMCTWAAFANSEGSAIAAIIDGRLLQVPVAPGNADYEATLEWVSMGNQIECYRPPTVTADDVRAEAKRRMIELLGARDAGHLDMLIANGTREAVRLLRKNAASWTAAETERAAVLEAIDVAIENIRARSNAMELAPPADYRDDTNWL